MEGRPGKKGIFSSSNLYVHLKTTVFATQTWSIIQHMVICIKPNCCYLPSLETGQSTSGLESPLWIFGAPNCFPFVLSSTRGKQDARVRGKSQGMNKPWSSDPFSIWSPSSLSPSSLGRKTLRECWHPSWPQGQGAVSQLVWDFSCHPTLALHEQEGKINPQAKKEGKCAKWLIGFYGNWLLLYSSCLPHSPSVTLFLAEKLKKKWWRFGEERFGRSSWVLQREG